MQLLTANRSAFVTIADFNEEAGNDIAKELEGYANQRLCFRFWLISSSRKAQFVKCDVRSWDEQVAVFDAAVKNSPDKSIDIVIANAGIVGADDLYNLEGWSTFTSDKRYLLTFDLQTLLSHLLNPT